jgi:hypothetical protein
MAGPTEDWVTTPSGKLQTAELQARAAPSSDFSPPEDCFVKYGDAILRVYDFINLVRQTLLGPSLRAPLRPPLRPPTCDFSVV